MAWYECRLSFVMLLAGVALLAVVLTPFAS